MWDEIGDVIDEVEGNERENFVGDGSETVEASIDSFTCKCADLTKQVKIKEKRGIKSNKLKTNKEVPFIRSSSTCSKLVSTEIFLNMDGSAICIK